MKDPNNILFLKRKLRTSALIIFIWLITASFTTIFEYLFLSNYPGVLGVPEMTEYSFINSWIAAVVWALLGGFFFCLIELFYLQDRLQNKRFSEVVAIKMFIYFLMLAVINVVASALYNVMTLGLPFWDIEIISRVSTYVFSISFWHPLLPFLLILFITLFLIQINYKFGQGELWKFVRGKYFRPQEEVRIFMFLDINSSTTIAEQLGHIRFFHFINDFFKDITNEILKNRGDIVDYIGDEIIVSWTLDDGADESRCIQCFYDIQHKIEDLSSVYEKKYGLSPSFKAGIHCGDATIGEIGKIKKEITYFGDVMNTTARIQGICKEKKENLVVSGDLLNILGSNGFTPHELGDIMLRGKSTPTKVFGISK